MKFAANLSWMFAEAGPVPARYEAARKAGFKAVECAFIYDIPLEELVAAKEASGLEQVLINAPPGDLSQNEVGLAAIPNKEVEFKNSIDLAIQYAKALKCKRVHVASGKQPSQWSDSAMHEVYVENMRYAAETLGKEGILCLVEPVNPKTIPGYYMDHPDKACDLMKKINHPSLKLQLDIFHLQKVSGNLTENLKKYLPYTGHMQLAQVPDRHEPDSDGEVNYKYIFKVLNELGYGGYMGCEYKPAGKTEDGLNWMQTLV